jgi:predicted transcriptional regulator of viral defense system
LTLHGLTDQQHTSRVDAFVAKRHKTVPEALAAISFHVIPAAAMLYGSQKVELEQTSVQVSDPEKTLVDLLEYPASAGSVGKAVGLVERSLERVDPDKLIEYAVRGARPSTCQRLGVLLERTNAELPTQRLAALHMKARSRKSLLSMHPGTPRKGIVNARWNVIENDR